LIDYKKSGVDIETGDELVSWLQTHSNYQNPLKKNFKSDVPDYDRRVFSGIGGFSALYKIAFPQFDEPLLISSTDGVGTKVKLASFFGEYESVAQDLVAMCVNDLICCGGTPLFFLDYYASAKLNLTDAKCFLTGIRKACEKSHMVLIGGETAEMPGVYQNNDFDCAGFAIGIVDKKALWSSAKVKEGDVVIGLSSSGFHSNGYSLLRNVFKNEYDKYKSWLLEPTRLYVDAVLALKNDFDIHAAAHITGGGIDNLPRVIPESLKAVIKKWELPECFKEVLKRTEISDSELRKTLNCGIGFIFIASHVDADKILKCLINIGHEPHVLGFISTRAEGEDHVVWS
jgi:phosphoribosylformylglycinamidine cyclo-ligase